MILVTENLWPIRVLTHGEHASNICQFMNSVMDAGALPWVVVDTQPTVTW